MESDWNVLRSCYLFRGVPACDFPLILEGIDASVRLYSKGQYVLHIGETVHSLGILLQGNVQICKEDFWGNRNLLAVLHPGQIFVETYACVPGAALSVDVVAGEKCRVLFLRADRILNGSATCVHQACLTSNLIGVLARKNLQLNDQLTHLSQRSTRQKLLSYLSAQSIAQQSAVFDIPFNRQQLADFLSVERSAMSAELGRMRDEGLLRFFKNHFELYAAER